jgi:hypothetical protein
MKTELTILGLGIAAAVLSIYGYIANIVHLVRMPFEWSTEIIVRCIGIPVAPLGIVMGFIS